MADFAAIIPLGGHFRINRGRPQNSYAVLSGYVSRSQNRGLLFNAHQWPFSFFFQTEVTIV